VCLLLSLLLLLIISTAVIVCYCSIMTRFCYCLYIACCCCYCYCSIHCWCYIASCAICVIISWSDNFCCSGIIVAITASKRSSQIPFVAMHSKHASSKNTAWLSPLMVSLPQQQTNNSLKGLVSLALLLLIADHLAISFKGT
jgi:hypothetical protein